MTVKAIETKYRGYRFRSRLEARWAVFFDVIEEPYQYEPQGFEIHGIRYLPDFYLPNRHAWIEIKPQEPDDATKECLATFAWNSDNPLWIVVGSPWATFDGLAGQELDYFIWRWDRSAEGPMGDLGDWLSGWNDHEIFVQCRRCEYIGLESRMFHFEQYDGEGGGYGICCTDRVGYAASPRLLNAYSVARSVRFEYGETPAEMVAVAQWANKRNFSLR